VQYKIVVGSIQYICFKHYVTYFIYSLSIPNLDQKSAEKQGPVIGIKGRSLLPYCHFELEDSDYIRSARRNPELRGPHGAPPGTTLDPNTRVIEFFNVGINMKNLRKFHIVNPTNHEFTFRWVSEDEVNAKKASDFTCHTPEGTIRSGKKTEVRKSDKINLK
jgi:hydrocephalus-inducing protein